MIDSTRRSKLQLMIRRAVLLALAPGAACGSTLGGFPGPNDRDAATKAAADAATQTAADSAISEADSSTPLAVDAAVQPSDAAVHRDASNNPPPQDAGPCTPYWQTGDGDQGGSVLWPCGAPRRDPNDSRSTYDQCAVPCLGSHSFNFCLPTDANQSPIVGTGAADAGAPATILCRIDHTGRRPAGLVDSTGGVTGASVGDVLARAAFLEVASVDAFLNLADELTRHDAPKKLIQRLRKAAADEVRHARDVGAFARRLGRIPETVRVAQPTERELLDIALDNAREGCVRETYGVATALAQALRAVDPELRTLMATIALDEARHAELSWDLAAWLDSKLDASSRARVLDERRRAVEELTAELESPVPVGLQSELGIPSAVEARLIVAALRRELWGES